MNGQVVIGIAMMVLCLVIQCVFIAILLRELKVMENRNLISPGLWGTLLVLIISMLAILTGNLLQIALWAGLFVILGEFGDFLTAFYHSTVNFSTLGYGDLVMSETHRLLGALESLNGVLMIGLSTGTLFAVLNELMVMAWNKREKPP